MLADLLYPLCWLTCYCTHLLQHSCTPLHYAANGGHSTVVEHLISTPGIDVNGTENEVSWSMMCIVLNTVLYMDGDVKNKTIEQLLLSLHTKTSVSLGISSPSTPSAMFVSSI